MNKNDIQLLYEYDRWATARVFAAAASLTNEQFTKNLGGSFPSVRATLLHILAGEWTWLTYWKGPNEKPDFLAELRTQRETIFNESGYANLDAVRAKWQEIEKEQIEFVTGLTEEQLQKLVPARNTQIALVHLMQHLANHSTYHRGQISLMMRQVGAEPVATDFHVFLAEGRS